MHSRSQTNLLNITDEYNPYCSKWGYCISYDLFGDQGPGQSKGAVEDGTRGQCRDDKDCTKWAPSCSPLGYCRGNDKSWEWDGSFGSPTNPKPGSPQSDWIKKNAKSGGERNEEYYGKIEDDNRRAHVKFRKENPIFYEQIPVLKPRLEAIEKNVYEPCTYCKYKPEDEEGSDSGSSGKKSGNRRNGGNGRKKPQQARLPRRQSSGGRKQNSPTRGTSGRKSGKRPNNNATGRRGNVRTKNNRAQSKKGNAGRRNNQSKSKANGDCGRDCIKGCPTKLKVYMACAIGCGRRCNKK